MAHIYSSHVCTVDPSSLVSMEKNLTWLKHYFARVSARIMVSGNATFIPHRVGNGRLRLCTCNIVGLTVVFWESVHMLMQQCGGESVVRSSKSCGGGGEGSIRPSATVS